MSRISITDCKEYDAACRILMDSMTSEESFHISDIVGGVSLMCAVTDYERQHNIGDTIAERITQKLCDQGYFPQSIMT